MESRFFFFGILLISLIIQHGNAYPKQPRQDWVKISMDALDEALKRRPNLGVAKNVIIFMGDGMGIANNMASRVYNAQRLGKSYKDAMLSFEKFPNLGLAMTYNANAMGTGSGSAASAYLCGEKVNQDTIGVNQDVIYGRCDLVKGNELTSILEHSHAAGKWTGVISTARVTHASPAGVYAKTADRAWESDSYQPEDIRGGQCKDIAKQLIEDRDYIRVIMGGGRAMFLPNTTADPEYNTTGNRVDNINLIKKWHDTQKGKGYSSDKYKYVERKEEFDAVDVEKVDYLFGLFEPLHMQYEVDRTNMTKNKWAEPSIAEMTEKAIKILRKSDKGYFLFVESGRIDHAHHAANAFKALNETVALSDAVQRAVDMTNEDDTLVIVTSDHSLAFTVGGYPEINTNILGFATRTVKKGNGTTVVTEIADDGLPYTILSYGNGPSFTYHHTNGSLEFPNAVRRNLTDDNNTGKLFHPDFLQEAPIPFAYVTHGSEEVPIYALGPMGHLFHKTHQQTFIAHVMMYASCVGHYEKDKRCPKNMDIYNDWPVTAGGNTMVFTMWVVWFTTCTVSFIYG